MLSLLPTHLLPDTRSRIVAAIVAALLGVCTYHHWRAPDPVQHAKLDSSIDRIQELEREIVGDMAFMRVGDKRSTRIREHIDELGQGVLDLKRLLEHDYPSVVVKSTDLFTSLYSMVETQDRSVSSLMLHLEFMLERLNRLPETISALERSAPRIWQDPELTAALSSIQRDLFVSAARNVASAEHWFEEDLERMRALRDLAPHDQAPVIDKLIAYCESLTQRARLVDSGLRELEALPVGRAVSELRNACLLDFIARNRVARAWRWGLVLGLALAIAVLAFRILILSKSTQLDHTEVDLLKSQLRSKDDLVEDLELRFDDERIRAERAEASFRRARSQEQAALRVKKEFLTFLDHRVRGRARSLLSAVTDPEPSEERRLAIPQDAQALHDTLSDMFDMEELRTGTLETARTPALLDDLLDRVESYGRAAARTKAISLSVQRREGTPATIHTDPERLRRILQNLLEHAIVSTDTGEVEVSVEPAVGNAGRLQFTVRDTGRGMNSDRVDFLFTPPQEGERIEDRAEAMATPGLSIVPSLVRKLGGAFHVDSVVGRGTTVAFEIDVSRADTPGSTVSQTLAPPRPARPVPDAPLLAAPTRQRPDPSRPLVGRRILVAEDGEDNRRLMQHVLVRAGAEVVMAENGEVAYEVAMKGIEGDDPYDIVLMDMNMPVMDGYEATENLRADGYTSPIVALTASALPENRDRCLEVGCDEFLTKPVDAKVFAHLLEEIALARVGLARTPRDRAEPAPKGEAGGAAGRSAGSAAEAKARPKLLSQEPPEADPPAAESSEDAPLFSAYASDEDMAELIELFVKDLKSDIRRINVALADGDLESLGVLAHQLKGSAGSYGFPQLTEQADRLESCVRTGVDPDRLEEEVRSFVGLCRRICA